MIRLTERGQAWVMGYVAGSATILANGMPVLLGALAVDQHMVASDLGDFGSAGFLGQLAAVGSAFFWIHRVNWRSTSRYCLLGAVIACGLMAYARAPGLLIASSCLVGALTGACYAMALSYWGSACNATRAVSIGVLLQVLLASIFLYAVPAILTPRFGMVGGPMLMAIMLLPLFPLSRLMPAGITVPDRGTGVRAGGSTGRGATLTALSLMAIYYLGIFAVWSFLDRIGAAAGLDANAIGIALSVSMLVGALALVFTSILGERWGLIPPLALSLALWVAFFVVVLRPQSTPLFTLALIIFNFAWNVGLPYQIAISARTDPSGRLIVLLPAFQAAGAAAGPYLAGQFVGGGHFSVAYEALAVSVAIASVGYALLGLRRTSRPAATETLVGE